MISIVHNVKRQINQYYFIKSLIESYHSYVNEWIEKKDIECRQLAMETSEGDKEIENDLYSQEFGYFFDIKDNESVLFIESMLVMVYAYYESIMHKIAMDVGTICSPSVLMTKQGKVLSVDNKTNACFLYYFIRPLRNFICHNNSGTEPKKKDVIEVLMALALLDSRRCIEVDFRYDVIKDNEGNDNKIINLKETTVLNIKKEFVLEILDRAHCVLLELSEDERYATKVV